MGGGGGRGGDTRGGGNLAWPEVSQKVTTSTEQSKLIAEESKIALQAGSETYDLGIYTDLYSGHYNFAQYCDNELYLIKRIDYQGSTDTEWSDELWRYTDEQTSQKIASAKGLDFDLSPSCQTLIVSSDIDFKIYQKEDSVFKLAQTVTQDQLLAVSSRSDISYVTLADNPWAESDNAIWFTELLGSTGFIKYGFNGGNTEIIWYDTPQDMGKAAGETALNPETSQVVYSTYPFFGDTEGYNEFMANYTAVKLYLYDLTKQTKQLINQSVAKDFKPEWLDNATIKYNDPDSSDTKTYKSSG